MGDRVRNPPWLMWGNSQTVEVASGFNGVTQQLAKVSYGRPENWTWFFLFKLVQSNSLGPGTLTCSFNLTFGLGRAMTTIPGFEQYSMSWLAGAVPNGLMQYSNNVNGPNRDTVLGVHPQNVISRFPAQDIQLNCGIVFVTQNPADVATVQVDAHFTPFTHIRPGWFRGEET